MKHSVQSSELAALCLLLPECAFTNCFLDRRSTMRVSELDKMIATLESLERVDKTAD